MTKPTIKVAAAQLECRPGDIAANLALHIEMIGGAREAGVDLLVFPELSLTDYLGEPDTAALARSADSPELSLLAEAAGSMLVSVGFIERGKDGASHNAQVLFGSGEARVHRKLNLPSYGRLAETRHYAKGTSMRPANIGEGWRAVTLICADTWNPALPWLAALAGASLLIVPVASSRGAVDDFDNPAGWDLNLRHNALTYGLPTIMANHCGRRGGFDFWGGSRILDAFGRELARAGDGPEMIVADLSLADVALAQERLPTVRDADPAFVQAELARLLASA